MRTGVTYMGSLDPRHVAVDVDEMTRLRLDDVFLAIQENDFAHFPGKMRFLSDAAARHGIRPIAIFWGALNLFGGGRSSQFLLDHPEGRQVAIDGSPRAEGCYVNEACVERIEQMIDIVAASGFEGYFVDEPTPLTHCYCASCRGKFREWHGGELAQAPSALQESFRERCVVEYVAAIAGYCKSAHPHIETMTCVMPVDRRVWQPLAEIDALDNLGTDVYWVNEDRDIAQMAPIVSDLDGICKARGKIHHEWLQCWIVKKGRERRVREQGEALIRAKPDALYVWAWKGQLGTSETCDDPESAWREACDVLKMAKE